MRWIILFAPLALQLVILYALSSAMNRVAYARLGKTLYLLLMWPGVIVHELSHAVGCLLTGTKIFDVKLFSPREEGAGNLVLGFVTHEKPRNPFATFVVSAAPFFGGAAALRGILWLAAPSALRGLGSPLVFGSGQDVGAALSGALRAYAVFAASLAASFDWKSWKTWLALFLLFSVSSHVAPSKHDMKYALAGAASIAVLVALLAWLGGRYAAGTTASAALWTAKAVAAMTALLGYGLACVGAAAVLFLGAAAILDALAGRRR
ncbi:MAG: hypothetical protein RL272_1216 [Candidatus Parcubacteria bacterium]|jgi:hypothetical protein